MAALSEFIVPAAANVGLSKKMIAEFLEASLKLVDLILLRPSKTVFSTV